MDRLWEMNNDYYPDNWVVLKIDTKDYVIYKVLAGWNGGYTQGGSWRMNSGITKVEDNGNSWKLYGHSGSCYVCHKTQYQLRMNSAGIYNELKKQFGDMVEILPEGTDWESLV